jgi:hypothetical protein
MTAVYLADAGDTIAGMLGQIAGLLVFPVVGVVLLITGIRKRAAARKQASIPYPPGHAPGYPPPPGYQPPPGYPPNYPGYPPNYPAPGHYPTPGQPGYSAYPPVSGYQTPAPQPSRPNSAGTGLIVAGIVCLVLGVFAFIGALSEHARASSLGMGDCYTNVISSTEI